MQQIFLDRRTLAKGDVIRGKDRKGFQGHEQALFDRELADATDPRFELPAVIFETMRLVDDSAAVLPCREVTAKAHALYAYLMATARQRLGQASGSKIRVPFAAAQAYLGIDRIDRLLNHIDALNNTMVTYDLRVSGYRRSSPIPLLDCGYERDPDTGEYDIHFTIHPAVRQVMLETRRYALLELNAFRKFRSKYTARLYPRLALLAGQSHRKPLSFAPQELAVLLGWRPERFHFGSFYNRVLRPLLEDINAAPKKAPAVMMFQTEMRLVRGLGRGNPVGRVEFEVIPNKRRLRQTAAAPLSGIDAAGARYHIEGLSPAHSPAAELLAQAVTSTGKTIVAVRYDWRETVKALLDPANHHHHLRMLLETRGVGVAFEAWIDKFGGLIPEIDLDLGDEGRAPAEIVAPAIHLEKPREERMREHAIHVATWASKNANNIRPAATLFPDLPHFYSDEHVKTYTHPHMWGMLESAGVAHHRLIVKAFRAAGDQEPSQMRKSIHNLARAIAEWELDRAARIAKAIILAHKTVPARTIR